MDSINICHLYPDLLNLYGDRGNIIAMKNRLNWRGIDCNIFDVSINDDFDHKNYDIVFIGGGQDFEQEVLLSDIKKNKIKKLKESIETDTTFLCICGGYQLLGTHYKTWDNIEMEFMGLLDLHTIGSKKRMIGDFSFTCKDIDNSVVVGFENHSGKTFLGENLKPLGTITSGYGNNGEDKTEGVRYKNVFGSYSHGSLLPKNPKLCDAILSTALSNKYGEYTLSVLNDSYELNANQFINNRLNKTKEP